MPGSLFQLHLMQPAHLCSPPVRAITPTGRVQTRHRGRVPKQGWVSPSFEDYGEKGASGERPSTGLHSAILLASSSHLALSMCCLVQRVSYKAQSSEVEGKQDKSTSNSLPN